MMFYCVYKCFMHVQSVIQLQLYTHGMYSVYMSHDECFVGFITLLATPVAELGYFKVFPYAKKNTGFHQGFLTVRGQQDCEHGL